VNTDNNNKTMNTITSIPDQPKENVVNKLRDELSKANQGIANMRDQRDEAWLAHGELQESIKRLNASFLKTINERDRAIDAGNRIIKERDDCKDAIRIGMARASRLTKERDEAYAKVASLEKAGQEGWERGYKSGMFRVMAEVKLICANIEGGAK
jgi:chromosome segregation ATPase